MIWTFSDQGSAQFRNATFQKLLDEHNIQITSAPAQLAAEAAPFVDAS
jgi:hypothetical protein